MLCSPQYHAAPLCVCDSFCYMVRHAAICLDVLCTQTSMPHAAARENMLQRFAQVTPEGEYRPPPPENAKAAYATMVYVRATIVEDAGWVLARAATIAVRNPFPA